MGRLEKNIVEVYNPDLNEIKNLAEILVKSERGENF